LNTASPTLVTPILGAATATSIANGLGAVGTPSYTFIGDTNTGMWSPSSDAIAFSTAGSEAVRINSSGDVGIGTSSPQRALHINATGEYQFRIGAGGTANYDIGRNTTNGLLYFFGNQSGFTGYVFDGANGERMRITSAGNVGIGLTNPSVRMEIVGASGFNPATQNTYAMWVANAGSANGDLAFGSSTTAAHIQSFNAKPLILNSAGNNVGINESAPDYKLDVNGTFGFTPGSSVTPVDNGDVVFELTDNTTLTIKAKGSDGVVRSGTIILV
jgi:hypothetical protein